MAENKVEVVFGAQVAGLIAGVKQVKDEIEGLRSPVDELAKNIKGIAEVTGIAFAVDKIKEWTEHIAEAAENLVNLSETFGTSADRLKEFQNIMALAGGEGNNTTRAIIGLGRALETELKNPLSTQRAAFQAIGVSMEELRARAEDPLAVIDLLRQRFSALEPDFKRTEAFTAALGGRFYQLVPILKLTNDEWTQLKKTQASTGADASGIKQLDDLSTKISELKLAIEGFGKTFILNIVDPLKAGVEWITKFIESITKAIDLTGTLKPIPEGGASADIPGPGALAANLSGKGYSPNAMLAISRSLGVESNFDPKAFNPAGGGSGAYGIAQWRGPRQSAVRSAEGGSPDFNKQVDFLDQELQKLDPTFKTAGDSVDELIKRFDRNFLRSGGVTSEKAIAGGGEGGKEKTGQIPDLAGDYKSAIAGLDLEQKKNKENYEQWLELEVEKLSKIASIHGTESEEYKKELENQLQYTKQYDTEELGVQMGYFAAFQAQAKASFEKEKTQGEQAITLGKETRAKMLTDLMAELDREHAEETKALLSIIDNYATQAKERQKLQDQLIKMDAQYNTQRAQLEAQYTAEVTKEQAKQLKIVTDGFDTLGKSLTSAFNGLLTGQTTWAAAAKKIYQDVGNFFLTTIEEMGAKWAASGLASTFGGAVQAAVSEAQSTGGTGLGAGLAALIGPLISLTTTSTTQTAATLANTVALTANTAALGVSAAGGVAGGLAGDVGLAAKVLAAPFFRGGGIVPSAAGGWALPSFGGATPAMLHGGEMVLPQNISQGLQGAINGGSLGGAGHVFNLNVSAMDGASVMRHGPAIVASINSALRNGSQLRSNGSY